MPGAKQMKSVADLFTEIEFWRLRPAQEFLVDQPGTADASRTIAVAAAPGLLVAYTPVVPVVALRSDGVSTGAVATWVNPRTGERAAAAATVDKDATRFVAPGDGDWVLVVLAAAVELP
jgi:hypothetical protein